MKAEFKSRFQPDDFVEKSMKKLKLFSLLGFFLFFLLARADAVNILGGLERFVSIAPGGSYDGKILLSNRGNPKPVSVKIYQSDYRFNSKGENYFEDAGTQPRSNSGWIKFAPERLLIGANDLGNIDFSVKVPEKSDLSGLYWSLLMIEPQGEDDPELMVPTQGGAKIRTVSRFALQILTTIGQAPENLKGFKFLDRQVNLLNGRKYFEINAENNGLFYMRPTLWAEFFDSKGKSVGRYPGGAPQILPGCSVKFRIDITDLPLGNYEALVVADTGKSDVVGARYKLKIE